MSTPNLTRNITSTERPQRHNAEAVKIKRRVPWSASDMFKLAAAICLLGSAPALMFLRARGHIRLAFLPHVKRRHAVLRIYITDIPDAYVTGVTGRGAEEVHNRYGHASLGALMSSRHDLWDSAWHQIDCWYIDQLATSPLRTYDADAADIILAPAILNVNNDSQQNSFIENAPLFLPYLHSKPHIMVLNHAPSVFNNRSNLLRHPNSKGFVFLSFGHIPAPAAHHIVSHIIGVPQFSHVHWSRGSRKLRPEGRRFDGEQLAQTKAWLAFMSFSVRHYADRVAVDKNCRARADRCLQLPFRGYSNAAAVYEGYASAWYALHPRADFVSRSAWFETLLVDTIPVVFQPEYYDSVPFAHLLDYQKLMVYVPDETILGNNGTNVVNLLESTFRREEALERLRYIHAVRHVFQYSLNPEHALITWNRRGQVENDDDAFTLSMKCVLENICQRGWLVERCS